MFAIVIANRFHLRELKIKLASATQVHLAAFESNGANGDGLEFENS